VGPGAKKLLSTLQAGVVLLAVWGLLAGVGLVAGVIPLFGGNSTPGHGTDPPAPDGGAPGPDAGMAAVADGATDATVRDGASNVSVLLPATRYLACGTEADSVPPALSTVSVLGRAGPELAVGCGAVVHLFAVRREGAVGARVPVPTRVAWFSMTAAATGEDRVAAGPIAAGDVDGDGRPDLVIPFARTAADGTTRGGSLFLVRRQASDGFEPGSLLGGIAAVGVGLASFDNRPGLDVAALNRPSGQTGRPGELWVFGGGASPVRVATLRAGRSATALAIADLDRDGHADAIAVAQGDPRVDVFFGDGAGRFPRTSQVAVPGGSEITVGDLDGDEADDLVVRGEGLVLIRAAAETTFEPRPIDAPMDLTSITIIDLDRDGKRDLIGIRPEGIARLRQMAGFVFEEQPPITLAGLRPAALAIADFDGDSGLEAIVLCRAAPDAPWELVLLTDVSSPGERSVAPAPIAPAAAPLVLHVPLE